MVMAVVYNKEGENQHFAKPCFGFLSYINTWDEGEDDDWDDEDDDDYEEPEEGPMDGFSSHQLSHLVWTPEVNFMQAVEGYNSDQRIRDLLPKIFEAFPQYYEGFSVVPVEGTPTDRKLFAIKVPLEGQNMQTIVMGCMMLRNVLEYTHFRTTFDTLINKDTPLNVAFILAVSMVSIYNMGYKGQMTYWSTGGDDQIFGDDARVIDFKNMIEGGVGTIYQGEFGETDNGYGRYGQYNGRDTVSSERTCARLTLTDTLLVSVNDNTRQEIANSRTFSSLLTSINKTCRYSAEEFEQFVASFIKEVLGE